MNSGNVFILVCGEDKVWLWIGSDANADERAEGSEVAMALRDRTMGRLKLPISGVTSQAK